MIAKQDLNSDLLTAEYAVRGPIVNRAQQLEEQGKKVIYCNIGNPQALKQKPLTYLRQILSLVEYPELLHHKNIAELYPADVLQKAKSILEQHPHGMVHIHKVPESHSSEKQLQSSSNGGMEFHQTKTTLF